MFPYDPQIQACLATQPTTIAEVLATQQTIDSLTIPGDGLHWFNRLYWQVTQAVAARVDLSPADPDAFQNPALLARLDVLFAGYYFRALQSCLAGQPTPDCWQTMLDRRNQTALARIQFALAGMNAHINHDLALAVVDTSTEAALDPTHDSAQYADFTALNTTLDSLIDTAKTEMHLRLLGDALPPVSALEDTIAAWSMAAAREAAWNNAELLWHLRDLPALATSFAGTLDGLTAVVSKGLLIPVP